ncbi:MAG: replication-relaxation family protein [Burkholderiales bacterium]|jgi:DNA-binding MarR family transcriptional regulator|nr:replication-relaxation family protein [Burkholderiales bacterium]
MNILQPRDLEILNFIILFGYVKECHLAILCNLSLVQIRRIIRRLEEDGYVKSSKVLASSGNYVFLTALSGKILETKVLNKANLNTLNHDTLLIDLYFYIINNENIHPDLIKTDKQLRKEFGIFRVNTRQRVSDLLIDDKIGIELELSEKPRAKLQEIINTYIINDSIKLVCYFLQSASLLNKIYTLAQNNIKFRFYLFEVDENKRFNKFQQYNGNEFINIDKLNLFELPEIAPKRFGSYQF